MLGATQACCACSDLSPELYSCGQGTLGKINSWFFDSSYGTAATAGRRFGSATPQW